MPAGWAALGAAVIGGVASDQAAKQGRAASNAATGATIKQQQEFADQARIDNAPYMAAGAGALAKIAQLYGIATPGVEASPGVFDAGEYLKVNRDVANDKYWKDHAYQHWNEHGQFENRGDPKQYFKGATDAIAGTPGGAPDMSGFTASPDYAFNLAESQKAIDRSAAARGGALSGRAIKEGERYASGLASTEFNNYFNRLAGIAGIGQNATVNVTGANQNATNNISSALINQGNQRASGYQAQWEGLNNAAQGGISNALLYKYMKKP